MKKSALTLFIILATGVAHAQTSYTATFNTNQLSFDTVKAIDNNVYTKVNLNSYYSHTTSIGEPELPMRTIQLIVPSGQAVSAVSVTNIQTHSFNVKYPVYPADSCGVLGNYFMSPDVMVYGSNNAYPVSPIIEWNQDRFDGSNIVSIILSPFEYYPSSGLLKLITSITVNVSFTSSNRNGTIPLQRLQQTQKLYDSILYHMVDNPWDIPLHQTRPTIVDKLGQTSTGLPVYEYVVVAPQVFESSLHDFVTWKKQKGCQIGIVNIEDIINAYPCGDTIGTNPIEDEAGSLRLYLRDAYRLGTFYAFLVGDPNPTNNQSVNYTRMPYRYGCIKDDPDITVLEDRPTTDWYFSDLTGDWRVDTDEFYGEPTGDSPSYNAEIMVGRLICTSNQDILNWVEKLLIYEKRPGNDNAGYVVRSLVSRAENFGDNRYWDNLPDFQHNIIEELPDGISPDPTFPLGSEVISTFNNNKYGLWTWFNHGGTNLQHSCMLPMTANINHHQGELSKQWKIYSDSLCVDNGTTVQPDTHNSLDYMTNRYEPSIIYATSCHVIPFDINKSNSSVASRNCGESFTVGGQYGGVAFLGNTVDALAMDYYVDFATTLNSVHENNVNSHLGVLETQSKHYISFWREHFFKHNLIGDPECQIWTDIPTSLQFANISQNIFHKEVINDVEISVTGFNNNNTGNCTVTLYSENDVFKTVTVPINPQGIAVAVFDSIFPTSTSPISVTATCYNHIPVQTYIPVTEACQINVTTNEIWSGSRTINCDVIVHENASLTITGMVRMNVNNKIKVLPGGTLVLDGGKITCAVQDYQWQGVRVLGTGSGSWQGLTNGHYSQGYVCLKNNAEIHEARVAIDLWDGINYGSTGGIADISDATFHNNGIAIRALCFKNQNPSNDTETAYKAHMTNCDFLVDENYPGEGAVFTHHINLFKVRGVQISGCNFSIQACPMGMYDETNSAIFLHNGGCIVKGYCSNSVISPCPDIDFTKTYFRGFTIGINAINDVGYNSVLTVRNSVFLDNTIGVRTLNDVNTTVLFSDFFVGSEGDCGIGIYLEKTPDFCIEENTFVKSNNASQGIECIGIVADNTLNSNDIYRNSFSNLTCANFAKGSNCNSLDEGLTYSCNDNAANYIDFFVPFEFITISNYAISPYQGSINNPAGNKFSQTGAQWHFYNGSRNLISYYYSVSNPLEEPLTAISFNVRKQYSFASNTCLSNYGSIGNGTPVLPPSDRQQKENDYYNSYINYHGIKRLYENYIDGGNTSNELNNVLAATSENMWELRSELLGLSPYLSQQVLQAFVNRDDVFPQSVIFEVLAANPEELTRDSLLIIVENNTTLPEYMIAVLKELAKGEGTYRSVLESQMSMYKHNYHKAAKDIIRSIVNDTIYDKDDLRIWLGNLENKNADRQIIASYMENGNDSIAFALARMLPSLYGLTGNSLAEHNEYMELLTLYDTLYHQGRTVYEMRVEERAIVDSLSIFGNEPARSLAKGIREATSGVSVIDCPEFVFSENGLGDRVSGIVSPHDLSINTEFNVCVSPNPAKTWIEVTYTLPTNLDYAKLTIYNVLGNSVAEYDLIGQTGKKVLDLRSTLSGVYTYTVSSGKQTCSGKLVIVK